MSVIFFGLNILKGTAINLTVVILHFRTLSGTKLQIFTPKRYDERPHHFYMGATPQGCDSTRHMVKHMDQSYA